MNDFLPEKAALLEGLRARMTPEAWERVKEDEANTIALIIRGRCAKVIEGAFAEFAELFMRMPSPEKTEKAS